MGLLLLWILLISGWIGAGFVMFKTQHQRQADSKRKIYRLAFPPELTEQQVLSCLRAVSGTLRPRFGQLVGTPSIVFEVFATNHTITHRIKVPFGHEPYVLAQLRLIGVNATPEDDFETRTWNSAVELGVRGTSRTLRIPSISDTSHTILSNFQAMEEDQAMLMQWVVSPVNPHKPPVQDEAQSHHPDRRAIMRGNMAGHDEVNDRRKKLEEPNYVGVLRLAAYAGSEQEAKALIGRVKAALSSVRGPDVSFQKRAVTRAKLLERIERGSGAVVFPLQLSATELSALLAWRMSGNPLISGLSQSMTRPMPAPASVPSEGRVLGNSTMYGQERPIALAYNNAVKHMHVTGPPGVGKTTMLRNLVAQDMHKGYGVIVIEAKNDLFVQALDVVPEHRLKDVIVLDFAERDSIVGFNLLDQGNNRTAIDELATLINIMYRDNKSITAPQVIHHLLHALSDVPGSTFVDLHALLEHGDRHGTLRDWQESVAASAEQPEVKAYMEKWLRMSKAERTTMAGPVINRTWEFMSRSEIRRVFGQRQSSFKMSDVISGNKILLVNLSGASVGGVTASIAGTLLVNAVWQAVRLHRGPLPNFMYLDEFQSFTNLAVDMEDMLAKSRSAGLGLVLAHQYIAQLDPGRRTAVLANTATKFAFETTAADASILAKEFGGRVSLKDTDFMSLAQHEGIALIATDSGKSPPTTVLTRAPYPNTGLAEHARYMSKLQYGRPVDQVDQEISRLPRGKSPISDSAAMPEIDGWIG